MKETFNHETSIFENKYIRLALIFLVLLLGSGVFLVIDLKPNLSHVNISIFSGSIKGNYYAIAQQIESHAKRKKAHIKNVSTKGSLDNIQKLLSKEMKKKHEKAFAFVQNGMKKKSYKDLSLIAHLPISETVFFLSKKSLQSASLKVLRGKRIGIGPSGSGIDMLARQIFNLRGIKDIPLKLTNHSFADQLNLLITNKLDIAMFVIANDATFIDQAINKYKLKLLSFDILKAVAKRLPFLAIKKINKGYYNPLLNIPSEEISVLTVDTLIINNGTAKRSDIIGLLSTLSELYPNFINHNKNKMNYSGYNLSKDAQDFFDNQGPGIFDRYVPWVANYVPLGNLVQLIMAISILFNAMNFLNRFRLWRVDAIRMKLENSLYETFGPDIQLDEIDKFRNIEQYQSEEYINILEEIIHDFTLLKNRSRKYSVSMLVPMGQEMGYRYQESLIQKRLFLLYNFKDKLTS